MAIKVVDEIHTGDLNTRDVLVVSGTDKSGTKTLFLARDDYYYDCGKCYSGIELTQADVQQLMDLFTSAE